MPHIRVRGLPFEDLEYISERIVTELADITQTPFSHFTLEYEKAIYLSVGGASAAYPFFEILWFDRGCETKAKVARKVDELVRAVIDPKEDITVVFHDLKESDYFENGEHF